MSYRYELEQDGMTVAAVEAPTEAQAFGEVLHYAHVYSQDGPVKVFMVEGRHRIEVEL